MLMSVRAPLLELSAQEWEAKDQQLRVELRQKFQSWRWHLLLQLEEYFVLPAHSRLECLQLSNPIKIQ